MIDTIFRYVGIVCFALLFLSTVRAIRKKAVTIDHSLFTLSVCAVFLLILIAASLFPEAAFLKTAGSVDGVLILLVGSLLVKSQKQDAQIAQLQYKIRGLAQELALREHSDGKQE